MEEAGSRVSPGLRIDLRLRAFSPLGIAQIRRLIWPERLNLQWQAGALFLTTGMVHALNYAYHVAMSRALGPADYGALVVLLSLSLLLVIPMNALQTTIALQVAGSGSSDAASFVPSVLLMMRREWLAAGLVAWIVFALLSPWIASALQLPGLAPVIIIGASLVVAPLLPGPRGLFQGTYRFSVLGASLLIESAGKLLIGLALVAVGLRLVGATGGIILGALGSLAYSLRALAHPDWQDAGKSASAFTLLRSAAPVALTLGLFGLLTNADVIAVKMLFPPRDAGYYAAASMAGKIILYAAWPVWLILFPMLGQVGSASWKSRRALGIGVGLTVLIGMPILALYVWVPHLIVAVLFGTQYRPSAVLFWPLGLAMIAYQLAFLAMSHELAVGRLWFLRIALLGAVALLGILIVIPRTLMAVASTTMAAGIAMAGLMGWVSLTSKTVR